MSFEIVRNDITNIHVDAIVNAANQYPIIGHGIDFAIHKKAGPHLLLDRLKIGKLHYGEVAITKAYQLHAKYVIHAASPIWKNNPQKDIPLLKNCYQKALELAFKYQCESIAFPLLSAGNHGFPSNIALKVALDTIQSFLMHHDIHIILVVFNKNIFHLSEKLFHSIQSYIDETYIQEKTKEEYEIVDHQSYDIEELQKTRYRSQQSSALAGSFPTTRHLSDLMKELDETFSESLIRLIDQKGLKDPDVYKKANVDRKLFNKIKLNKDYKPSKKTCIAFALALELNLDETKDFIGKAGYALTHSSKFDIIIEYFILQQNYNIFEINEVLFAFDQPLIGA